MRKFMIGAAIALALVLSPGAIVSARVGGSVGGHMGGHTGGSGGMMHSSRMSGGRRMMFGRRTLLFGAPGVLIVVGVLAWQLTRQTRRSRQDQLVQDTYPIAKDLAEDFEDLFYAVETAWSNGDVAALYPLMTAKYYGKQRAVLDRFKRQGRVNHLDALVVVDTQQEPSDAEHPHVVVTAQARDYFEYLNQPPAYNQQQKDAAMIERFTEVWELAYAEDGHLLVANIRQ